MKQSKKEKEFSPGEKLTYTGRGFLGFDQNNRNVEFVEYVGQFDAMVKYNDYPKLLVSKYELQRNGEK